MDKQSTSLIWVHWPIFLVVGNIRHKLINPARLHYLLLIISCEFRWQIKFCLWTVLILQVVLTLRFFSPSLFKNDMHMYSQNSPASTQAPSFLDFSILTRCLAKLGPIPNPSLNWSHFEGWFPACVEAEHSPPWTVTVTGAGPRWRTRAWACRYVKLAWSVRVALYIACMLYTF